MKNLFHDPAQRGLIRTLAKGLENYIATNKDPHAESAALMADLAWCVSDATAYTAPKREKVKRGKAERDE